MKYKKVKIILFVLLMILNGCNQTRHKRVRINSLEEYKNIYTSKDFFIKVKEIKLEATKESIISFPYDIAIRDKKWIFISSRNTNILEFNFKGNFLRKIGKLGNGPGEYKQINSIFFFKNKLGIFDFYKQKIIFFNKNGKYLKEFSLPFQQIITLRRIITAGNYIYIHVPYTNNFPYHILEIDSTGHVKRKFVKALKDYSVYSYLGLFHGAIVKSNSDTILYEMNSFSNNILTKINLKKGTLSKIKLPRPNFFHKIPKINNKNSLTEIRKNFYKGTDILNLFLIKKNYLVVIYYNKLRKYHPMNFVIYNLNNYNFKQINNLNATYSDGNYLYELVYYENESNDKNNLLINPKLIVSKIKGNILLK